MEEGNKMAFITWHQYTTTRTTKTTTATTTMLTCNKLQVFKQQMQRWFCLCGQCDLINDIVSTYLLMISISPNKLLQHYVDRWSCVSTDDLVQCCMECVRAPVVIWVSLNRLPLHTNQLATTMNHWKQPQPKVIHHTLDIPMSIICDVQQLRCRS